MGRKRTTAAGLLVIAVLPLIGTGTAHGNEDDVIRRGSCSERSDWKLKASPEDGRIEVEGEVDSNRNGQVWRWVLRRNGKVVDRGRATTQPPSGSFEVERRTRNGAGTDRFRFRAVNTGNGEVCVGRVRF